MPPKKNTPPNYTEEYANMPYEDIYKELIMLLQKLEKQEIKRVDRLENTIDKILAISEVCDQRLKQMQEKIKILEAPFNNDYDDYFGDYDYNNNENNDDDD